MLLLQAALLGVVQGLTEFLPVSSSAHLLLARLFFGWDAEQFGRPFDVACHVGTLAAILIYFRTDLLQMLAALPRIFSRAADEPARLAWLVGVGTIPLIPMGLFLSGLEDTLRTPKVIVVTLAVVGVAMLVADRLGRGTRRADDLSSGEALALGVAQGMALIPGVSRSGATITTGLAFGLERSAAARFSFLLGVPAMFAAAAHEGRHLARAPDGCPDGPGLHHRHHRLRHRRLRDGEVLPSLSREPLAGSVRLVSHRAGGGHGRVAARVKRPGSPS